VFEENMHSASMYNVKAYLPVAESFGFSTDLCSATSGQAFPQMVFDHWSTMGGDATNPVDKVSIVCSKIRERKGMDPKVPAYDHYHERL
ncbi:translation elongation factor 2, partial [Coemansia sp. RSA 1933]